jgi:hypothetical protein
MITSIEQYQQFPTKIHGIVVDNFEKELSAIEAYVVSEMNLPDGYTDSIQGDVSDLFRSMLCYFVYFWYCQNLKTKTTASVGETKAIAEHTASARGNQIMSWNKGVDLAIKSFRGVIGNPEYFMHIHTW